MKKISFKIPATSANLGPGLDCLAVALDIYNLFHFKVEGSSFKLINTGLAAKDLKFLGSDENNLVVTSYKAMCDKYYWPKRPFTMSTELCIPISSGLGSSASAVVAGVGLAYALNDKILDRNLLLDDAFTIEEHPDNIAAAIFGGFTTAFLKDRACYVHKTLVENDLKCMILKPSGIVDTKLSRSKLPLNISLSIALDNIAKSSYLTASIISKQYSNLTKCMLDNLHEPNRIDRKYEYSKLKQKLLGSDFYGWALSGSGPAVLILCANHSKRIKAEIQQHFANLKLEYSLLDLNIDNEGLRYYFDYPLA